MTTSTSKVRAKAREQQVLAAIAIRDRLRARLFGGSGLGYVGMDEAEFQPLNRAFGLATRRVHELQGIS